MALNDPYAWTLRNIGGGGAFPRIAGIRISDGVSTDIDGVTVTPDDRVYITADVGGVYVGTRGTLSNWSFSPKGSYHGVSDQNCYGIAIDPTNPDIAYLGTEGGGSNVNQGLQKTSDAGAHWTTCTHPASSNTDDLFNEIQVSPADHTVIYAVRSHYAGTTCQLLRSIDTGANFSLIYTSPSGVRFLKLILHPTDATILYAVSGASLGSSGSATAYKSIDSGVTWTQIASTVGSIQDLGLHPANPIILFATTSTSTWRSVDSGATWTKLTIAGLSTRGGWLAIGSAGGSALQAADSLVGAAGTAATFVALISNNAKPPSGSNRPGTYLSLDPDAGVAGDPKSVTPSWTWCTSKDWGVDWKGAVSKFGMYSTGPYGNCNTISVENYNAGLISRIFWATAQFCFVSSDMGVTFQPLYTVGSATSRSTGIDNIEVTGLDRSGDDIYASVYDLGILHSANFGQTWKSINDYRYGWHNIAGTIDELGGCCLGVITDPTRPNMVWAALTVDPAASVAAPVTYTLIRSVDYGASWNPQLTGVAGPMIGLALDPDSTSTNRTLYITRNGDVYRSTDDGITWTLFFTNGGMRTVAAKGNTVVMGGESGLYITLDGGATAPARIGATQFPTVALTDTVEKLQYKGVHKILINGTDLYATYYNNASSASTGLFKSTDNGANWSLVLADGWSRWIVADSGGNLYHTSSSAAKAGGNRDQTPNASPHTGSTGLKYSTNNGTTWAAISADATPLPWAEFVLPVVADNNSSNPRIVIGIPGAGFYTGIRIPG